MTLRKQDKSQPESLKCAVFRDSGAHPSHWWISTIFLSHYSDITEHYPPFVLNSEIIWDVLNLRPIDQALSDKTVTSTLDVVAHAKKAAAIYFPETEEFYFRRDWTDALDVLEMQLLYGYARALPDQYGNMTRLIAEAPSLDRRLALSAVMDGDALLTLWLYADADFDSPRAAELAEIVSAANSPAWKQSEPVFDTLMRLPLTLGGPFAAAMVENGGLEALDAVIVRPPRSTEQILHIDRYLDGDEPQVLTPVELQLQSSWTLQATETLGEALIGLTMADWSLSQFSPQVAENWGGDLLQVWDTDDGSHLALWQLVWDSSADAAIFYGNLLELLPTSTTARDCAGYNTSFRLATRTLVGRRTGSGLYPPPGKPHRS